MGGTHTGRHDSPGRECCLPCLPSEIAAKPAETEVAEPTENVRCWHLATTWTPSRAAAAVYSTGKLR